jgi:hypothetical protein
MPNLRTFLNFARSSVPHGSEVRERFDTFFSFIYFGPFILFCIGGGLSLIFDDRPHTPGVLKWHAAVVVIIVGCLIAGAINGISVIVQTRRRNLAHEAELLQAASITIGGPFIRVIRSPEAPNRTIIVARPDRRASRGSGAAPSGKPA